jgi:hypothetical protein
MHGALYRAVSDQPQDPEYQRGIAVLNELDALLATPVTPERQPGAASASSPVSPQRTAVAAAVHTPAPEAPAVPEALWEELQRDPSWQHLWQQQKWGDVPAERRWREMQFYLLRLKPDLRHSLQESLARAVKQAGTELSTAADDVRVWLGAREELLFPGLKNCATAKGVRTSPQGDVHPEIRREAQLVGGLQPPDIEFFINNLSFFLTLIEHSRTDQFYSHSYLWSFDPCPLTTKHVEELITAIRQSLELAIGSEEPEHQFLALVDLDEAVHSVFHQPPDQEGSWWRNWKDEFRKKIWSVSNHFRSQEVEINIQNLQGNYAAVASRCEKAFKVDSGGAPGQIVECLRIYAKISKYELKGRVIYCRS